MYIKKKTGGFRKITAPNNKSFMLILRYLNEIFKAIYTPSDYAMGFTEGRSVVDNAEVHKAQNYIFNIDLKDFFPSIEQPRVWKRLQIEPFNFPIPIANILAGLCSMKETRTLDDGTKKDFYILPQGAPTSPIITNMICDKLDRRLAGLAKRFNANYTRYADDITFSSMHNVYQNNGEFIKELHRIITDQGFTINDKKTRLQKLGARQEVTGIIVSKKLNVTQKYVRDIRNILYMWDRYGYSVAYSKFFPKYKEEKGHLKKGTPDLINVLDGKLLYLKMVKGENDSVYNRLNDKFTKLRENISKTNNQYVTYIDTKPIIEFEKKNNTSIIITYSDTKTESNNIETDFEPQEKTTIPGHRYAYFMLKETKILASVHKDIQPEEESQKEILAISSCRDSKNKTFWLVHKMDKIVSNTSITIDIEELNDDLDFLLNT